ncbi:hypothetical protein SELMODRAFT_430529 [Selaginella moellendorffii]|uniref:Uncharacterized protein n=1 Tax=Selaginella moellendorffii TaxID=88036 RepID=D8T9P4_SELML|nr:hypothetical protein SELMODRAFT_430529 [Selaginella moellendorffii]
MSETLGLIEAVQRLSLDAALLIYNHILDSFPRTAVTPVKGGLILHIQEYLEEKNQKDLYMCRLLLEIGLVAKIYINREYVLVAQQSWWYTPDPAIYTYTRIPPANLTRIWCILGSRFFPKFIAPATHYKLLPEDIRTRVWARTRWVHPQTPKLKATNLTWNRALDTWINPTKQIPKRARYPLEQETSWAETRILVIRELSHSEANNLTIDWASETLIVRHRSPKSPPAPRPTDLATRLHRERLIKRVGIICTPVTARD